MDGHCWAGGGGTTSMYRFGTNIIQLTLFKKNVIVFICTKIASITESDIRWLPTYYRHTNIIRIDLVSMNNKRFTKDIFMWNEANS